MVALHTHNSCEQSFT